MVKKLFEHNVGADQRSGSCAGQTQQTEKLQRPSGIVQQEFYDQQIQEYANRPANAVIGLAALTLQILDGNFGDLGAGSAGQRGNEAVQFAIQLNLLDDFAPVG